MGEIHGKGGEEGQTCTSYSEILVALENKFFPKLIVIQASSQASKNPLYYPEALKNLSLACNIYDDRVCFPKILC